MKPVKAVFLAFFIVCLSSIYTMAGERSHAGLPVPHTVSPEIQALISAPFPLYWNKHPKTTQDWKTFVKNFVDEVVPFLPVLKKQMGVIVTPGQIGGVPVFTIVPSKQKNSGTDRILLNFHGGGYVLGPGESGLPEAILMAGIGGFKVISVDYRMAPDFPYPAAMDDAMAVYRGLIKTVSAKKIGVFGTSTGGGMTLALILRAKAEELPLPAAIAPGTPWSDLTKTGDSYFTNDHVDNILVSYDGWLGDAAKLYAGGHDLRDPLLSPVYGDVTGFPPTLLTTGTRDLFLSNTVRMHRKLLEAGTDTKLIVFEGMSHAQYHMAPAAPETRLHFGELKRFFNAHLR
jgi:acetyl esterase/lipase